MDAVHVGRRGRTFGGNPLSCAAAPVALDQPKDPAFLARARELGDTLRRRLEPIAGSNRLVGEVYGRGPMLGIEPVSDPATKGPAPAAAFRVVALARERGLMLMAAGIHGT